MSTKVLVSDKGEYLKIGNKTVSYIVIIYDKCYPAFIEYDCDENKEILDFISWDEETWEDCLEAISHTYSFSVNWKEVYFEEVSNCEKLVAEAIDTAV